MAENEIAKVVTFDFGELVRHRASGEVGVVVAMSIVHESLSVSYGFGKYDEVSFCMVEKTDDSESTKSDATDQPFDIDRMIALICDALLSDEDGNSAVRLNVVMPENKHGGLYRRDDLEEIIRDVLKGELDG